MPGILDLQNFTMNPEEAQGVSEAIFIALIMEGALGETHDIVTGIEHKTQIPFIGNLGLLGKKITGCDRDVNGGTIPLTEKWWDPVLIGDRLKHCATDVPALLKLFNKAKKINPDFFDRIDSEDFGVIIAKVTQAMESMLNRKVWFEDTAADNVSGAGVIKNGVDVDYFNTFDGLFKQIFTEITVSAPNYVEIPANSGVVAGVQIITFGGDIIADNTISIDVDGETVTQDFSSDSATTLAALAVKIAAEPGVSSATVLGNVITVTGLETGEAFILNNAGISGGASQVSVAIGIVTTASGVASYANQELPANTALGIFRKMYNKMDPRFFQALEQGAQPTLLVTRELFQNYQDQLEDKSLAFTLQETKDGTTKWAYRGVPIKVRYDWDNNIRTYMDNGTTFHLPHRAILTVKENIPVGTLNTEDLDTLRSWFEMKDTANYIDFDLTLDAKHLLPYLTVAAY